MKCVAYFVQQQQMLPLYHPYQTQRPMRMRQPPQPQPHHRRSVLYISEQPVLQHEREVEHTLPPLQDEEHGGSSASSKESPRFHLLPPDPHGSGLKRGSVGSGSSQLLLKRIGFALLVFWLAVLTLFVISHLIHEGRPALRRSAIEEQHSVEFAYRQIETIPIPLPKGSGSIHQYRTCCWDGAHQHLYCDNSIFGVVWDQVNQSIQLKPFRAAESAIPLEGLQCTFYYSYA
jgi:hypothetical protein